MSEPTGAALVAALERRFVLATSPVRLDGRTAEILRPQSAEALISEDDFAADERLPYWADLWPSAVVLAEYVPPPRGSRRLLELGCGLGLVAASAMLAGWDVLATDYYEDALRFTRANAWRWLAREPATRLVDWRAMPADLGSFDAILAADVLYERPSGELVAAAIARHLAPGGEAVVADPGRAALGAFLEACHTRAMVTQARLTAAFAEGTQRQTITLHAVRWPDA